MNVGHVCFVYITWPHAVSAHSPVFPWQRTWLCMMDMWRYEKNIRESGSTCCKEECFRSNQNVSAQRDRDFVVFYCCHFVCSVMFHIKVTRVSRDNGCSALPQQLLPINGCVSSYYTRAYTEVQKKPRREPWTALSAYVHIALEEWSEHAGPWQR